MPIKTITDCGATLLIDPIPSSGAVSLGLWINLGSRDEGVRERGLAHVIEHMLFKGTARRSAYDIASQIDSYGGEINGSTGKENTYYSVDMAAGRWREALDILLDMYFGSRFDRNEFQKERYVILDEIDMAVDDPEDFVGDLFSRALWGEHPLGLPVLGNKETIASFKRSDIARFYRKYYQKNGLIISVAGRVDPSGFQKEVERLFRTRRYRNGNGTRTPARSKPNSLTSTLTEVRDISQVHVIGGVEACGARDEERFALLLLNTLIGNSFSSRLFQRIREEKGLCYAISSGAVHYSDSGEFTIGFSTSPENLPKVLDEVDLELRNVLNHGIGREELELAKDKVRGNYILNMESIEWKMIRMAMQEMLYGKLMRYDEVLERVNRVTLDDVMKVVDKLFRERAFSFASIGPPGHDAFVRQFGFSFSPQV
jgi:predicted Zn-dependent peptidase